MKKIYLFVFCFIVLFCTFELLVRSQSDYLSAKVARNKESIWEIRTAEIAKLDAPVDVIFLGDSTVTSAIHNKTATELLGKKVLNLGLTGDLVTYGDYKILSRYLEKFPPPKAIVFWHTLDVWHRGVEPFIFNYTGPTVTEKKDHFKNNYLRRPHKYPPVLLESLLVNNLALYRYKVSLRGAFNNWFQFESVPAIESKRTVPTFKWPSSVKDRPSADAIFWLKRLVEICREKNIKIFAGKPPILKNYSDLADIKDFQDRLDKNLETLFQSLSIPVISEYYIFPPEQTDFYNMDHLNDLGAVEATRYYIGQLKVHFKE